MRDADGNTLEPTHHAQRNLLKIGTSQKRSIRFKYDDHSRIVRAEVDQTHWAAYKYDANGTLTDAATLSSVHSRHYSSLLAI
jgi:hypothetical protein